MPNPSSPEPGPALDEVLVALQKTLSRVSSSSAQVPAEDARALISGPVTFSMTLRADVKGPDHDRLHVEREGELNLQLTGTLQPDIRVVDASARHRDGETGAQVATPVTVVKLADKGAFLKRMRRQLLQTEKLTQVQVEATIAQFEKHLA